MFNQNQLTLNRILMFRAIYIRGCYVTPPAPPLPRNARYAPPKKTASCCEPVKKFSAVVDPEKMDKKFDF